MKKKIFILGFLMLTGAVLVKGQVGINLEAPNATLDVQALATDGTTAEGIIAPKLTLAQLISKNTKYSSLQTGAIVYITDVTGTPSGITTNVTSTGYYYFDGTAWQSIGGKVTLPTEPWLVQGTTTEATSNTEKIFQTGNVAIGTGTVAAKDDSKLYVQGAARITSGAHIASSETDTTKIEGMVVMKDISATESLVSLGINPSTGQLGLSTYAPAALCYMQKRGLQTLSTLTGQGGGEPVAPIVWSNEPTVSGWTDSNVTSDLFTNNLNMTVDYTTGEFTFPTGASGDPDKDKIMVEMSGYACIDPQVSGANAGGMVNLIIQVKRAADGASASWTIVSGSRSAAVGGFTLSTVVSPATMWAYPGDKVRICVQRPSASTAWGTNTQPMIDRPNGLTYVGGFKISAI